MKWILFIQSRSSGGLFDTVINIQIPWKAGNFLTICATISSSRTLLHRVSYLATATQHSDCCGQNIWCSCIIEVVPVSPGGIWLSSHSLLISDLESRSLTCKSITVWRQPFYKIAQHNVTFTGWVPSVDLFTFIQIRHKIKCMSEASLVPFQLLTQSFSIFTLYNALKHQPRSWWWREKIQDFPFRCVTYTLHYL